MGLVKPWCIIEFSEHDHLHCSKALFVFIFCSWMQLKCRSKGRVVGFHSFIYFLISVNFSNCSMENSADWCVWFSKTTEWYHHLCHRCRSLVPCISSFWKFSFTHPCVKFLVTPQSNLLRHFFLSSLCWPTLQGVGWLAYSSLFNSPLII